MKNIRTNLYRKLLIILILLWCGGHFYHEFYFVEESNATNIIENRINYEIDFALDLLNREDLTEGFQMDYPMMVYKGRDLIFWNNYKTDLAFEDRKNEHVYYVANEYGDFIVCMDTLSQERVAYILIPLERSSSITNKYISSSLNERIFFPESSGVEISSPDNEREAFLYKEAPICVISATSWEVKNTHFQLILSVLFFTILLSLIAFIWHLSNRIIQRRHVLTGIGVFLLCTFVLRIIILVLPFPYVYIHSDLFNSTFYASGPLNPSLGDLTVNYVLIFLNILFIWGHKKYLLLKTKRAIPGLIMLYLVMSVLFILGPVSIRVLFFNSNLQLDLNHLLNDVGYKTLPIINLALLLLSFLLLMDIFNRYSISTRTKQLIVAVVNIILGIILLAGPVRNGWLIITLNTLIGVFQLYYPRNFIVIRMGVRQVASYAVTTIIFSLIVTQSILYHEFKGYYYEQQSIANRLLSANDVLGEFLLSEASKKISEDVIIQNRIFNPFAGKNIIYDKISRVYLGPYFDKYHVQIRLYNGEGLAIDPGEDTLTYNDYQQLYQHTQYKTQYSNIFFVPEDKSSSSGRYFLFVQLNRYQVTIGKIIIELSQRKFAPGSAYPFLLADQRMEELYLKEGRSYAVYRNNKFNFGAGSYNYQEVGFEAKIKSIQASRQGLYDNGHFHYAEKLENDDFAIVSKKVARARGWLGNFCFISILMFLAVVLFLFLLRTVYYKVYTQSLAIRIQLFTLSILVLSFLLVGVIDLSISINQNKKDLIEEYKRDVERLKWDVIPILEDYFSYAISEQELNARLSTVAAGKDVDLNVFNKRGQIIASSQPLVFDNNLIASMMNPLVLEQIFSKNEELVVQPEHIGSLDYYSLYQVIRSESEEVMAITNIPFYEGSEKQKKRIQESLSILVIILFFMLVTLLPLSYISARRITYPLRFIAERFKQISFSGQNMPIQWGSQDEIGLLVKEYNSMLTNLELSKETLRKQEKETAWRELARQVAHEIKNPLTPMRLSLQHFQRTVDDPMQKKKIESLLQQIDTISDIATSFSSFARMPIPKNEQYNLTDVLESSINLFKDKVAFSASIPDTPVFSMGDANLMSRIFSNIFLNGIQSVPESRDPKLWVSLAGVNNEARISIKDNGHGVPEEIQGKIFLPNFTTKEKGSGIGLAIARRGVEYAGGKIWFETSIEGTTFFIELPCLA